MSKYLELHFRDAGLFRKHEDCRDIMFNMAGREKRKSVTEFIEPITVHQISNMLHVLFGERPKPINRETEYNKIDYIFEKALASYLLIETYKTPNGEYYKETIQTKKSVHNAWNTVSYMNWQRVKRLLGNDFYSLLILTLSEVFNNSDIENISFNNVKEMILKASDKRLDDMFVLLNKNGKKTLYQSIYGKGNELFEINQNRLTQLTVLTGLDKIIRLNGRILVPVSDEDIDKIKSNKGCATLLDGGLVYIKGIKQFISEIDINNFTEVKRISLEKQ